MKLSLLTKEKFLEELNAFRIHPEIRERYVQSTKNIPVEDLIEVMPWSLTVITDNVITAKCLRMIRDTQGPDAAWEIWTKLINDPESPARYDEIMNHYPELKTFMIGTMIAAFAVSGYKNNQEHKMN